MTWQGGKRPREAPPRSRFARLAPLVGQESKGDIEASLHGLATALKNAKAKGRLHLRLVSGAEFRPFVSRLAHEFGLAGWVLNRSGQVEIHVEGSCEALTAFKSALLDRAPPLAQPECPQISSVVPLGLSGFTIEASEAGDNSDAHIPPDYFVCDDCLAEMQNPAERRYRYPFINCTQCGPRYTLIDCLPYDRPNTAMADFKLCSDCQSRIQQSS